MRKWLLFLATVAIGCSSEGTTSTTTGRATSGSGGAGGSGGSGGSAAGGSGGATGGSGGSGATGGTGGTGGSSGGTGGSSGGTGGSAGGTGGSSGGTGGSAGSTGGSGGGTGGSPDGGAGRDASGGTGGSGDASTRPDATAEEQQACTNFADAFCTRLQSCSSFVMSVLYGDVATCKQRWVLNCLPNFGVAGTSASPTKTNGCTQAIGTLACNDFLLANFGSACTASAGTIPQGGACGDDAQCATTFCARSSTSVCGTCQPTTNAGDPCLQGSCSTSTNTVCPAGTTTCVKPKAGQVGDACVGQEECDVGHQVGCNTVTKQCVTLTLTAAGGTCGAMGLTSVAVCGTAGTCSSALGGTCTAAAPDGQTCSTGDTGPHCMQPAKCVGGKCVIPDPSTCK